MWRIATDSHPTLATLTRRQVPGSRSCARCGAFENATHVFARCPSIRKMWSSTTLGGYVLSHPAEDMGELMKDIWPQLSSSDRDQFAVLCLKIWHARNSLVHDGSAPPILKLPEAASSWLHEFQTARASSTRPQKVQPRPKPKWSPPQAGKLKLNVSATTVGVSVTGFGGIIRDHRGSVSGAFCSHQQGSFDHLAADALSLREGLLFAKTQNLTIDVAECASRPLIRALTARDPPLGIEPIVADIRVLLAEVNASLPTFIHSDCNKPAFLLASSSLSYSNAVCWLSECPPCIEDVIATDLVD